jgi:hypothetical protein
LAQQAFVDALPSDNGGVVQYTVRRAQAEWVLMGNDSTTVGEFAYQMILFPNPNQKYIPLTKLMCVEFPNGDDIETQLGVFGAEPEDWEGGTFTVALLDGVL